ncbi:MAG: DUF488 family protein, partial [Nitrospiraceae bacterium]|nr:DUF488 family protein [Nitrospiraceae bacterium]
MGRFPSRYNLSRLEHKGNVRCLEKEIALTNEGARTATGVPSKLQAKIRVLRRRYADVTTNDLVDSVYARHPWFTLNADPPERRAASRPDAEPAIFTLGYQGFMIDGLLNLLLEQGVTTLVDVRANPVARRYGFHKSTMRKSAATLGIGYLHEPALGVPSAQSCLAFPKTSMSVKPEPPLSCEHRPITRISTSLCGRVRSIRGSGNP